MDKVLISIVTNVGVELQNNIFWVEKSTLTTELKNLLFGKHPLHSMTWELRQSFLHYLLGGNTTLIFFNNGKELYCEQPDQNFSKNSVSESGNSVSEKVRNLRNALTSCNYPFTFNEKFSPTKLHFDIFWNVKFENNLGGINNIVESFTIFNQQPDFRSIKDYLRTH